MRNGFDPRRLATVALGTLLGASAQASISGPWPAASGISAGGDDPTAMVANPASMSLLEDRELVLQLTGVLSSSEDETNAPTLGLSRSESDSGIIGGPTFAYARRLGDRWHAGVSVFVPGGFGDDYDDDGVSRYLVEEWSLVYVSLAPALSYRVNEKLSIGVSAPINYSSYTIENSVFNIDGPDGEMELDASSVSVNFTLGAIWEASERTRFGISYRSKVDAELEGEPDFSGLTDLTRDALDAAGLLEADVEVESTLPPMFFAGMSHTLDGDVNVSLDVAHIGWSEFRLTEFGYLDGERFERGADYEDSWALSAGVSFPIAPRWRMGLGAAWMDSPVDADERTFLFRVDETRVVGIGLEYDRGEGRKASLNLSLADLGGGEIRTRDFPLIGRLDAEYEERYALLLDFRLGWE